MIYFLQSTIVNYHIGILKQSSERDDVNHYPTLLVRSQECGGFTQARSTLNAITPSSQMETLRSKAVSDLLKVTKEMCQDQISEPAAFPKTASLK